MSSDHLEASGTRRSLLVVSFQQFGAHTDTARYCELLRDRYRITYLCLDEGLPRREPGGFEVRYCARGRSRGVEIGLMRETSRLLRSARFDAVFLRRTKFSFVLRLLHPRVPMVFDIRTASIEARARSRMIEDAWIWFNSLFFRNITVISHGLGERLRIPRTVRVLPLGADRAPVLTKRRSGGLRLVYVGTFKNRRIERTIEGVRRFLDDGAVHDLRYTVIGFGSDGDVESIRNAIARHGLQDVVELEDRIDHAEVSRVLADHDVGIAFTPREPWFEHQPSTKVFEYLAAGLLCIATDSAANRDIIARENGILVEDTAEGIREGLHWVAENLPGSDPSAVADTIREHSWSEIVNHNLAPYLEKVME